MTATDYQNIQDLLRQQHSLVDAAEAHGTLAGGLCGAAAYQLQDWLREILPQEGAPASEATAMLRELYEATAGALREPDMELRLLLPEDTRPIAERAAALALWSQGFLYGLGTGGIGDAGALPGEAGEVVRDFLEITRAAVDPEQDEEANESAYAELVEFVRVGTQLLFEELGGARRTVPAPTAGLH
ncbi:MAG: UPF0149 family protein [Proteobacteria bacterium]|nr:UPF0149 family protein [Pseudomonadota bacterium]